MRIRHRTVVSIFAALSLSATAMSCEPPLLDPPQLLLDATYTPSNLPRGDYRLTNGQGETLMEVNSLAPEQEHNASFPLDKLDGTINIVAMKDGKEIYTQTVTHEPGKRIKLFWDIELARFLVIEDPEPPRTRSTTRDGGGGGKD